MLRRAPRCTLCPYTTLFRSDGAGKNQKAIRNCGHITDATPFKIEIEKPVTGFRVIEIKLHHGCKTVAKHWSTEAKIDQAIFYSNPFDINAVLLGWQAGKRGEEGIVLDDAGKRYLSLFDDLSGRAKRKLKKLFASRLGLAALQPFKVLLIAKPRFQALSG